MLRRYLKFLLANLPASRLRADCLRGHKRETIYPAFINGTFVCEAHFARTIRGQHHFRFSEGV